MGHGFFLRVDLGLRGLVARELLSEEFEVTESSFNSAPSSFPINIILNVTPANIMLTARVGYCGLNWL